MGDELKENVRSAKSGKRYLPCFLLNASLSAGDVDLHGRKNGQDQRKESLSQASERLNGTRLVPKESRKSLYHVALLFAVMFVSAPVAIFTSYCGVAWWASRRYVAATLAFAGTLLIVAGALTGVWTVLLIAAVSGWDALPSGVVSSVTG